MTWIVEQYTRTRPEWHQPKGLMTKSFCSLAIALSIAKALQPANGTIRVRGTDGSIALQITSAGNVVQS